jgi:hypothetical protein
VRRPGAYAPALLAALATVGGTVRAEEPNLEPRPPMVFFTEPDPRTAEEIDAVVAGLGDLGKVADSRALVVERFGIVSVPAVVRELRRPNNVPLTWNCALTVSVLRDRLGAARELHSALEAVEPLLTDPEPYTRAFSLLAAGSFHGADMIAPETSDDAGEVRDRVQRVRDALQRIGRQMAYKLDDDAPEVRVAAALAIGKRGGDEFTRAALHEPHTTAAVEPRQALLLAIGLRPGAEDEERLLRELKDEERRIRRAAALGFALQAASDADVAWLRGHERILKALRSDPVQPALEDGAEAVHARGVIAWRVQDTEEWRAIYAIAVQARSEKETAEAAVQTLLFCGQPWFSEAAVDALKTIGLMHAPVVAAFLLDAGRSARRDGVEVCREYLGNPGRHPAGDEKWDVRYHASVGILRALAEGRHESPELRRAAIEALEAGVKRGLPGGEFRTRLARVLERNRAALDDPAFRLPDGEVRWVEDGCSCPWSLLAREMPEIVVFRLNALVPLLFHVRPLRNVPGQPVRTDTPQRFLKACLDAYPYFSVLELRADRGRRPPVTMAPAQDPASEVRNPP